MKVLCVALCFAAFGIACVAEAQTVLFDFDGGPQYTGTPLDQVSDGIRAHFTGTGSGYSIQNIGQVIGMYPTGFANLGLSPTSVFGSDLGIAFFNQSNGLAQNVNSVNLLAAPQELACDSSSTMKISAYKGSAFIGSATAKAPNNLDTYTWPTINLAFTSPQLFDNVVVHFQSGPPTGGDWGGIFVADNLTVNAVPEPITAATFLVGVVALARRRRR